MSRIVVLIGYNVMYYLIVFYLQKVYLRDLVGLDFEVSCYDFEVKFIVVDDVCSLMCVSSVVSCKFIV